VENESLGSGLSRAFFAAMRLGEALGVAKAAVKSTFGVYLDLGKVRNLARVRLNGKDLGIVWCAP
jgi:hypothetical protein